VQRNYIVETALKAANKVALRLGLIEKELSIEILSQHRVDISNIYSVSPGVILREEREAKKEAAKEAEMEAKKAKREAKKAKKEAEREECIAAEAKKAKKEAERAAAIESAPVIFNAAVAGIAAENELLLLCESKIASMLLKCSAKLVMLLVADRSRLLQAVVGMKRP
jgi:hypothetical protein